MDPAHKAQDVGKIVRFYVQKLDAFTLALPLYFLTKKHNPVQYSILISKQGGHKMSYHIGFGVEKNMSHYYHLKLLIFCLFTTSVSFAQKNQTSVQSDPPNNCVYLSIMISNNTKSTCQLTDSQVLYGRMSSSTQAPVLIPPGTSAQPFEMRQLIYGPDIILTYECGEGHKISFESQQDLCVMSAGSINTQILYSSHLTTKITKNEGSYIWNRHGAINWLIKES